jgi:hypothetical protein
MLVVFAFAAVSFEAGTIGDWFTAYGRHASVLGSWACFGVANVFTLVTAAVEAAAISSGLAARILLARICATWT